MSKPRTPGRPWRWIAIAVGFCLVVSCKRHVTGSPPVAAAEPAVGYTPARWRLAPFEEVNRTVLWVSHIVVMHGGSRPDEPQFRPLTWRPDPPMPARTDAEALARALTVADLAARDPSSFGDLARQFSDDVVTRDEGGSLGGVHAGQLPQEFRDALAVLGSGRTSRVVKTALGYHVIRRRPPPDEGNVAGKRIVIRYASTLGGSGGPPVERERGAALELARHVAELAMRSPAAFDDLVRRYSEAADAVQSGDLGVYSLRDPGYLSREVERLGQLAVGEVAGPIDSKFGFEVLIRTAADPRPDYAMSSVQIAPDPNAKGDHESVMAAARQLADALLREIHDEPGRFDALRAKYCCEGIDRWNKGRGPPGLDAVLQTMKIGEVAAAPVNVDGIYVLPMRVDPSSVPPDPPPTYELPSPPRPDLSAIARSTDGHTLSLYVALLSTESRRDIPLAEKERTTVSARLTKLSSALEGEQSGGRRAGLIDETLTSLKGTLGPKDFETFEGFLNAWSSRLYMGQRGGARGLPGGLPRAP